MVHLHASTNDAQQQELQLQCECEETRYTVVFVQANPHLEEYEMELTCAGCSKVIIVKTLPSEDQPTYPDYDEHSWDSFENSWLRNRYYDERGR